MHRAGLRMISSQGPIPGSAASITTQRVRAEAVRALAIGETPLAAGKHARIALVAETAADARDVMVEGESGILAVHPQEFRPLYEPSKR